MITQATQDKFYRSFFVILLLVLVSWWWLSSIATANEPSTLPDQIAKRVADFPVIYADFLQTKAVPALKRPITTRGKLIYSKQFGVWWSIEQPYQISYLLAENKIVEIDRQGNKKTRSTQEIPSLAQVSRVFRSLLRADLKVLEDYFTPQMKGTEQHWQLQLLPKQQLTSIFKQVSAEGGQFIELIQLDEANGDVTTIRFTHSRGAQALTEQETRLMSQ